MFVCNKFDKKNSNPGVKKGAEKVFVQNDYYLVQQSFKRYLRIRDTKLC